MIDEIKEHLEEYRYMLVEASDTINDFLHKARNGFDGIKNRLT